MRPPFLQSFVATVTILSTLCVRLPFAICRRLQPKKEKLGFPVPTRVWLRDEKYYNVVKKKFKGKTAEKFFNTDILVRWLDEHFSNKEDNSRKVWTIYVFLVWYDIYFNEDNEKVEKPVNHLDELRAIAEARQEKKLNEFGEAIMTEAEKLDKDYDAPNFGIDKSAQKAEKAQTAEKRTRKGGKSRKRGRTC